MDDKELSAQERILQAAGQLLLETEDVERITMRQIAEKAGVSLGSINYYFRSKENLFNEAVLQLVGDVAASWYQPLEHQDVEPEERLRSLFQETAGIMIKYLKLSRISVSHALLQGDMEVQQLLQPLLREIFGGSRSEMQLRLLSFQLVVPFQVALLRTEALGRYLGADLTNQRQRETIIDAMINNMLKPASTN